MKKNVIVIISLIVMSVLHSQTFAPPENLETNIIDYNNVELTWDAPGQAFTAIEHHNGYSNMGMGTGDEANFICAARFDASDLADYYNDNVISGVNIICHLDEYSYVAIQIYEGGSFGDPGVLVYEEEITNTVSPSEWTYHTLTSPVPLITGNEYWIGYEMYTTGGHPAAVDSGPMVPDKGAWMYYNGVWDLLTNIGAILDYNWVITGVLSSESDDFVMLSNSAAHKPINRSEKPAAIIHTENTVFTVDQRSSSHFVPTRNSRSIAGYKIYRNSFQIAEITDPANQSFTDESLDTGEYAYFVTAIYTDPQGESNPSNFATVEIDLPAPENLSAQSVESNILLQWNSLSPSENLESYNIYRNGALYAEAITITFYIDINVPIGNYCYNVTAVYTGGFESGFSNDAYVVLFSNPGTLEGSVVLNDPQGNVQNVLLNFDVFSSSPDETGFFSINSVPGTFSLIASLEGFASYLNNDITITENQITVLDFSLDILEIPENLILTSMTNDVNLQWSMPELENRELTGFQVFRNDELLIEIDDPAVFSYDDLGLDAGNYTYSIRAVHGGNLSLPSEEETIEILLLSPVNLTLSLQDLDILLEWEAPDYTRELSGYRVYRNNVFIIETDGVTYLDENMPPSTYSYYVTSIYDSFESEPSNTETIEIVLAPPHNLVLTSQVPDILLEWEAPIATRELTGYRVYRDDDFIIETSETTFLDENMPTNTYTYCVTAMYDIYESEPSNIETIVHTSSEEDLIVQTKLIGNYPNPFNPSTDIRFQTSDFSNDAQIDVYNLKGQKVKTLLINSSMLKPINSVTWNGDDENNQPVSSGIYFYKLNVKGKTKAVKKCLLLK